MHSAYIAVSSFTGSSPSRSSFKLQASSFTDHTDHDHTSAAGVYIFHSPTYIPIVLGRFLSAIWNAAVVYLETLGIFFVTVTGHTHHIASHPSTDRWFGFVFVFVFAQQEQQLLVTLRSSSPQSSLTTSHSQTCWCHIYTYLPSNSTPLSSLVLGSRLAAAHCGTARIRFTTPDPYRNEPWLESPYHSRWHSATIWTMTAPITTRLHSQLTVLLSSLQARLGLPASAPGLRKAPRTCSSRCKLPNSINSNRLLASPHLQT